MDELEKDRLLADVVEHLRRDPVAGLPATWFLRGEVAAEEGTSEEAEVETKATATIVSEAQSETAETSDLVGAYGWEELEKIALQCTKCRLCETRNKVVFGVGKREQPLIAFVGEGPGADEDRLGEPFVGRAGQLLTNAITKGMGLRREDVYIANVVKCRPPQNRAPLPDETASCTPYLFRQLELLQPKVIVTLGQPAQMALSGVNLGITKLRGQWQVWRGIKLMPTFHPAYLLRSPGQKRPFWEDLQAVMREVGIEKKGQESF